MKTSHIVSFAMGAMLMLGVGQFTRSHAQTPAHVYELRTYYAMPGKLDEIKKRFRTAGVHILNNHNMKSVGYWEPQDNKDQTIIYILEHPSKEEADKNWAAFQRDPEWVKAAKESEANGKLIDHIVRVFMNPTDFSPMK